MFQVNRILVPVDFSDLSRAAISVALQMADRSGATVYALHVDKKLEQGVKQRISAHEARAQIEESIAFEESSLTKYVELEFTRAKEAGFELQRVPIEVIVAGGAWLPAALQLIQDEEIDLVVSGTHGPQGVKGMLLGSMTEKLLSKADCSVFVVKAKGYPYLRD